MKKKLKFISSIFVSSLLITPISELVSNYDNMAKAENINLSDYSKNDVILSKEMNRKELIEYFSLNNNVSLEEAEKMLFKSKFEERYAYHYRTIVKYLSNDTKIEFYTKGSGWNNYYTIERILNASVKHSEYSFVGTLYTNLENDYIIYYDIEGNLLDKGNTSVSATLNIGVGEGTSVNIGIGYNSNIKHHISESGRVSLY